MNQTRGSRPSPTAEPPPAPRAGRLLPRTAPAVLVVAALLVLLAAGCGIPRDPESTLDQATGGTLRAGITASDPWTTLEGGRPGGVEVALVERFAAELGARVEWVDGSEAD